MAEHSFDMTVPIHPPEPPPVPHVMTAAAYKEFAAAYYTGLAQLAKSQQQ